MRNKTIIILILAFLIFGSPFVYAQEKGLKESLLFGIAKFIERNFGYLLSDEFAKGIGTGEAEAVIYAKIMLFFFLFTLIYSPLRYVSGNKRMSVTLSIVIVLISVIMIPAKIISSIFFTYSAIAMLVLYAIPVIIALLIYRFIDNFFEGRKTRMSYVAKAAACAVALYFSNEARKAFAVAESTFLKNLSENNFILFLLFALGTLLIINIFGILAGEEGGGAVGIIRRIFGGGPIWRKERMGILAPSMPAARPTAAAEAETAREVSAIAEMEKFEKKIEEIDIPAAGSLTMDELKNLDNLNNLLNKLVNVMPEISNAYRTREQLIKIATADELAKFDASFQSHYQNVQLIFGKIREALTELTNDINNDIKEAGEFSKDIDMMSKDIALALDSLKKRIDAEKEKERDAMSIAQQKYGTAEEKTAQEIMKKTGEELEKLRKKYDVAETLNLTIPSTKNDVEMFKQSVVRAGTLVSTITKSIENSVASLNQSPPNFDEAKTTLNNATNVIKDAKIEITKKGDQLTKLKEDYDKFKRESDLILKDGS